MRQRFFLILFLVLSTSVLLINCSNTSVDKKAKSIASKTLYAGDFDFRDLSAKDSAYYAQQCEFYYNKILDNGFNGAVLMAKDGVILFEKYKGYTDLKTKEPITEHTPFHLASISKTFTGMAVLQLWEQNKLSLEDTLQKFFPQFPYHGITIKNLLSHRSGLPNYLYFMDSLMPKNHRCTNQEVLDALIKHKPAIHSLPGTRFEYCNTNFMLLAMIVENVTKQPFPQYMKQNIFEPLGMHDTYIFSITDTLHYVPTWSVTRPFPMDQYDCTYGDKNVYSTVRDMFAYDRALYQHTFLKKATLDSAFTPYSLEHRSMHNYGLAWRLFINNGDTVVYHNGKWHGTNTSFIRLVQDTATIIVLGNKENRNIYRAKDMEVIFNGKNEMDKLDE